MAHVKVEDGEGPRTVQLTAEVLVVGRSPGCAITVQDADASLEHCELRRAPDGWRVVDLESRNGTRLNGRFVNQNLLSDGDVIEVGEAALVFHSGATAATPAVVPVVAPLHQPAPPVRPAAAVAVGAHPQAPHPQAPRSKPSRTSVRSSRRREDPDDPDQDRESRRSRRRSRSSSTGLTVVLVGLPTLFVMAFLGWQLMKTSGSVNRTKADQMLAARDRMDWKAMIRAAEGADPTDTYEYERIQDLLVEAQTGLKGDEGRQHLVKAEKAWQAVQTWRFGHRDARDEYVGRIDGFLDEYGDLGSAPVQEAQRARIAITGKAVAKDPKTPGAAWRTLARSVKLLEDQGRFGAALGACDDFLDKWGGRRTGSGKDVATLKEGISKRAGYWFARQISTAQRKAREGSLFQARRVLDKAAGKIGIPEYEDRAAQALKDILDKHSGG